jgi:2'-5' RNA ligase/N-acetylglutamate synthase-like GNAT family acetyltransferase
MSRLRLAVVVVVPGATGHEVDGLRRALGDGARERIPPHITLVPPVNVNASVLGEALAVVRRAAAAAEPLRLELGPVTTFWPATPVLYLAVGGDLAGLGRLRDAVFSEPLARPLTRPFVPHVTLARGLAPERLTGLTAELDAYRTTITADRVHVLREAEGRRWEPIADATLGRPAIIGRGGLEVELRVAHHLDPVEAQFFETAWSAHRERSHGALPAAVPFAVTARREDEVVGVATGDSDDELHLERLVVGAAASNQGVGGHLLREVEVVGRSRGCRRAVLVCQEQTAAWYADRGWRVVQSLPAWSHGADFVRMDRDL